MIALAFDLNVAYNSSAKVSLTKVLDSFILIPFSKRLSPVTDVTDYVIRNVQKNLIMIIHTASIVSILFYTIDIKIPIHHGRITFVLQATLKLTKIEMISLHLRSSNKIIQDISSFLLKELNFKLLLCQSTLFQFKFGINSLTIYAEYFTHVG